MAHWLPIRYASISYELLGGTSMEIEGEFKMIGTL